jgi:hypothetical protein
MEATLTLVLECFEFIVSSNHLVVFSPPKEEEEELRIQRWARCE